MLTLGIETSCDETAAAVYDSSRGLLSNIIRTQDVHQQYGGVVPEIASRDHIVHISQIIERALHEAQITKNELDGIAYTAGPGLTGSLMVGATIAKSLAYSLAIPAIAVNHLEAHILAPFIENPQLKFPFLALLISGGHTQLIKAASLGNYTIVGQSIDDAVGEAFDKVAKLLGLPYPGGAALAQLAESGSNSFNFPVPLRGKGQLNFSFSGLKTAVFYALAKLKAGKIELTSQIKANISHSFQHAAITSLIEKTITAVEQTGETRLVVAGGVSANQHLRTQLKTKMLATELFFASSALCTDNAAMVAYTGQQYLLTGKQDKDLAIRVQARWPMDTPLNII